MKYDNVLDLIGNTPLVKLENYSGKARKSQFSGFN